MESRGWESEALRRYRNEIERHPRLSHRDRVRLSRAIELGAEATAELRRLASDGEPGPTAADRRRLGRRIRAGDRARQELVESHLRLVVDLAVSLAGANDASGEELSELIERGNRALLSAAESHDPRSGIDFEAHARRWIGRALIEQAPATPTDRERAVLQLRFGLVDGRPHTLEEISDELGVTRERIRQIEAKALAATRGRWAPRSTDAELGRWNRAADVYHRGMAQLTAHGVDLLLANADLRAGSRVLDLGCGPGHLTAELAKHDMNVVGVDFAPAMIAAARDHHPGLRFTEADAACLPHDDDSFDVVLANFAVPHFPEPEAACREALRVLAIGGRFVFTSPGSSSVLDVIAAACASRAPTGHADHPPTAYEILLMTAGFERVETRHVDATIRLDDVEPLALAAQCPPFDRMAAGVSPGALRSAVRDQASRHRSGSGYVFRASPLVGIGVKGAGGGGDRSPTAAAPPTRPGTRALELG